MEKEKEKKIESKYKNEDDDDFFVGEGFFFGPLPGSRHGSLDDNHVKSGTVTPETTEEVTVKTTKGVQFLFFQTQRPKTSSPPITIPRRSASFPLESFSSACKNNFS